ncbi:MAG: DUF374 domain-containing protein [Endomicrobium sp.]|jgi:lipopolysaccharide heptosyltransferase II|nr:DUF374 domain-containing protein [Endomicrobium sp.]
MYKILIKIITLICYIIDKTITKVSLNDTLHYLSPSIYFFWHGSELPMLLFNKKNSIVVMVSLSKDGEILSRVLKNFGYLTVRGSSSRGARSALIKIIKYAKRGYSVAIAADGPKGPYHKLKSGVIYIAKKTGLPLIPISCSSKRGITLNKSWDKTLIPLPFSKIVQIYGNPIYVAAEDNIENKVVTIEKELNKIFTFTEKYYWCKNVKEYLLYHPAPKILIIQPGRIGDIIFSLPLLSALKERYPKSRISWLVDDRCYEILEGNPCLENIFVWYKKQISFKYYKDLSKRLKNQKFDLSIDLNCLAKSIMFVKFACAKFKIASSSTNGMKEFSWLFSKEIKSPPSYHCIERHLEIAKYLDCSYNKISYPIAISEINYENVKNKLYKEDVNLENMIGIHPGGGWTSRRWCEHNFAMLCRRLKMEICADIVIIGGKEGGASEKGLSRKIVINSGVKVVDMTGKFTLKELCAFLKMCKVFIGNEAGPIHIATVLGTQVVAILGPTNANHTGPYGENAKIIQHKLICQPCRNRNCKNNICMRSITVSEVFEEVKKKYENLNY